MGPLRARAGGGDRRAGHRRRARGPPGLLPALTSRTGGGLGDDAAEQAVAVRTTGPPDVDAALAARRALLKPLAWQGVLCNGPSRGSRPTFTSPPTWVPGWPGLPDPAEAVARVIPAYLGAHGPATPATFDAWLLRGAPEGAPAAVVRRARVSRAAGWIAPIVVEGGRVVARWALDGDVLVVEPFPDTPAPDPAALESERIVWERVLGRALRLVAPGR